MLFLHAFAFFIFKIMVSKGGFQIFDCQIAQSRGCFVPSSENKKN